MKGPFALGVTLALLLTACGAAAPSPPSGSTSAPPASHSVAPKPAASASAPAGSYKPTSLNPTVHVKFAAPMSVGEVGIFTALDRGYFN